jgi:hypothetical protein
MRDVFKADRMHGELHCPANNPSSNLRMRWVACISALPLPARKPWSRWGWFWRLCKTAAAGGLFWDYPPNKKVACSRLRVPYRQDARKKPSGRYAGRLSHATAGPALLRFRRICA